MLTLLSRAYCHLCDEMRDALAPIALEVGRGFGGASAQDVLVAASLFGAGTALSAVGIAPGCSRSPST